MINEKAADVLKGNDKIYDTRYCLEEARQIVIDVQKRGVAVAAWIETLKR
jgi:hypothetical protein